MTKKPREPLSVPQNSLDKPIKGPIWSSLSCQKTATSLPLIKKIMLRTGADNYSTYLIYLDTPSEAPNKTHKSKRNRLVKCSAPSTLLLSGIAVWL